MGSLVALMLVRPLAALRRFASGAGWLTVLLSASPLLGEDTAFFESKIRPILVERCYECHSADKKQKANLLLDTKEGPLKGGDTGPAVVPGDPAKSLLIQAVKWSDDDLQMPPKKKLSDEQIADLEAWVKMGAPDPRSGSRVLTKIEQHLENARQHWAFQPIIDPKPATLDSLLLPPTAPPADKRTLLRRAYLDLVGLPPTYAEVTAFLADPSPDAFAKVLDRLLADPRYGERWGRHWLDVARYADTMGSIFNGDDTYPYAWTYRDYVVRSFNADKPYDRFLLEQIAGDQLDTAQDPATLAGMAFLGLGTRKDRQLDDDTLDDTIDVIGRGLMGLTIGCARCHDHKLEPITTKDYYGLYSVLKSSKEPEILPALPQPETAQTREFAEKNRQARCDYGVASLQAASHAAAAVRTRVGDYLRAAQESGWKTHYDNKPVLDVINQRKLQGEIHNATARSRKTWIEAHPEVFGPFLEFITGTKLAPAPVLHPLVAKAFAQPAATLEEIAQRYNDVFAAADTAWRKQTDGQLAKPIGLTPEELDLPAPKIQPRLIARLDALEAANPLADRDLESLRQILIAKDSPLKVAPDRYDAYRLFLEDDKKAFEKLAQVIADIAKHPGAPARAMVFVDAAKPYDGKVFLRGNPNSPGSDAPRKFLTVLQQVSPEPFPKDHSGRLQLARAIASRDNPLTARVIVNRVWSWHFGQPLVGTPSDFGFRGDRPSNQPLLDHLAAWFMEHGWSFKQLHKYVMLSAAYQSGSFALQPLELEPFRDSILSVTGRLKTELAGRSEKIADSTRRTLYGFIDRKALPSLYRSFDFPNPSFSAPQRSRTALAPRALILLNSPLLTESARALAAALSKDCPDDSARIEELYHRTLQRPPTPREIQRAHDYLAAYPANDLVHPETKDWQYGYGEFDAATQHVKAFAALTNFDGKAWKATPKARDGKNGGVMLDALGGDPGPGSALATIRRWVAPLDGEVNITAELTQTDPKAEGIIARVISSHAGLLREWKVQGQSLCTELSRVPVKKGETLDFIVCGQTEQDAGPYRWSPSITMPGAELAGMRGMAQRWDARSDFADPNKPEKPLTALEELCQALLLSPEFGSLE